MRAFAAVFLACLTIMTAKAQQDDTPSNSFEAHYAAAGIMLRYSYDNDRVIHDYSGNWDLDRDGTPDEIYFIGTGGAHLYYYLRVVLSSDQKVRDFKYLESDRPVYTPMLPGDATGGNRIVDKLTVFSVLQVEGRAFIYIRLDTPAYMAAKKILSRHNVQTDRLLLGFEQGKAVLKDHPGSEDDAF